MHRKFSRILTTSAVVVVLASCGAGNDDGAASADSAPAAANASFNEADSTFVHEMIGHHEQAVEMAELALNPSDGARPEIVDLSGRIKAAQQPEIDLMKGWLVSWGETHEESTDTMAGMDHSGGMTTAEEMTALSAATGPEFDKMWLTLMITHHRRAVSSALVVQQDGVNPDVRKLAEGVIAAQNAEIEEMTALLGA
jgi:uncharacterized protein (DUF305 family)